MLFFSKNKVFLATFPERSEEKGRKCIAVSFYENYMKCMPSRRIRRYS